MVRHTNWPSARLGMAFVAVAILLPAAAYGQDRSTQERLDRIERDLNMLQRQVYRGAPPSVAAGGGDPNSAVNVEIRMERLEAQMRDLTGRVEEFVNGLDQLKQRVEQINSDIDVRLGQTGPVAGGPLPARPGPAGGALSGRTADPARLGGAPVPGGLMPPGTVVPAPGGGGLNPIFNTLTPPGPPPGSSSGGPPAASEPASIGGPLPTGSPTEQYNYAFGLLKQADYPGAEAALKAFIQEHPNDPMAGNAQFWLGETYYERNRFADAAVAFAEGYKRYPKGAKAADELLKLGLSLARTDQKKNACVALAQLDREFPNPGAAIKQAAATEKKRLGC